MQYKQFPYLQSLTPRHSFLKLRKEGAEKKGRLFIAQFISEESENFEIHLGLTVTKKLGNAVMRNRLKRLLRQAFLTYLTSPSLKKNKQKITINLIARFSLKKATLEQITKELNHLLPPCDF